MRWRELLTEDGSRTLVDTELGEACHSSSGAWREACERYAATCRLRERARHLQVIRLLDVGTGLGLNLAAAVAALEGTGTRLEAVSLELDASVLEAAEQLSDVVPNEPAYALVRDALRRARRGTTSVPIGEGSSLRLILGDARETLPALEPHLRFDAVFLDPFSPGRSPSLWQPPFLAEIARRMGPSSWLSTYTASLAVRAALAAAGLRVGPAPRCGAKAQGTVASPDQPVPAFDARTARKLFRRVSAISGPSPGGKGPTNLPSGCSLA